MQREIQQIFYTSVGSECRESCHHNQLSKKSLILYKVFESNKIMTKQFKFLNDSIGYAHRVVFRCFNLPMPQIFDLYANLFIFIVWTRYSIQRFPRTVFFITGSVTCIRMHQCWLWQLITRVFVSHSFIFIHRRFLNPILTVLNLLWPFSTT